MSADALLFELLDTLAQAFPRPPAHAKIIIGADDTGAPALVDLEGTATEDAPLRPFLGRDDAEVLDALQQMIGDLGMVTMEDAGFCVTDGRVDVRTEKDGAIEVWLVEHANTGNADDDVIRLKRRFDSSEQTWLVHTAALFSRLNATEAREDVLRTSVEERLGEDVVVGLDLDAGHCLFRHDPLREERTAPLTLLGSYSSDRGALLWGWGNDVVAPSLRKPIEEFRQGCRDIGLRAFVQAELPCPIEMADRLVRHAAVEIGRDDVLAVPYASDRGPGVIWVATTVPTFD